MSQQSSASLERRSFLTRLNTGIASFAAMAGAAMAQEKSTSNARYEPARHEKDDWLDQLPGKHRVVFDTTTPEGFGDALFFANNYVRVNKSEYALESGELAVVIVARHRTTQFAYNDAIWAKWGRPLAERARVEDPKTRIAPKINIYNTPGFGDILTNRGVTVDTVFKENVHLAVCSISTRGYASGIVAALGGKVDEVFQELIANLVGSNARMVPAGIVTVNRAQERGYTLVST
ncbi:MAG: hypothetical protein ABSB35_20570 [Bryobacteraceae bacterium]|jgi:hypothetical protein